MRIKSKKGIVEIGEDEYIILKPFTRCDKYRKKRTLEVLDFSEKLFSSKEFNTIFSFIWSSIVALNQALISYQNGAFLSTVVMCRVAVEGAIYELARIDSFKKEKDRLYPDEYDYCMDYISRKMDRMAYNIWIEKLTKQGILDNQLKNLAKKIRDEGNYAAHWGVKFSGRFEKTIENLLNQYKVSVDDLINKHPEEVSKNILKEFVTNKAAYLQLERTIDFFLLMSKRLFKQYYK